MSARNPTLRVIECVQTIVHCPSVLAKDTGCYVPLSMMADLQEAYAEWIESRRKRDSALAMLGLEDSIL